MTKPRTINTLTQFKGEVVRQMRERSGMRSLTVHWEAGEPKRVKYPTGLMGYRGYFTVNAGGALTETIRYVATYDKHSDGPHTFSVKPMV